MSTDQETFDGFSQIGAQMPAVCALLGLWGSLRGSVSVVTAAITTHQVDFLMIFQPQLYGGSFTVRKHIDNRMSGEIDDDRSIRLTTFPRKIIYSYLLHLIHRWEGNTQQ